MKRAERGRHDRASYAGKVSVPWALWLIASLQGCGRTPEVVEPPRQAPSIVVSTVTSEPGPSGKLQVSGFVTGGPGEWRPHLILVKLLLKKRPTSSHGSIGSNVQPDESRTRYEFNAVFNRPRQRGPYIARIIVRGRTDHAGHTKSSSIDVPIP